MRILAIRGENLASLPRLAVELEQPPLCDAGLFLIAGPTGAGKSTLLDALCLALYDRTPRLTREKSTVRVGGAGEVLDLRLSPTDPRSILRHGATEAFAQVDFACRGRRGCRSQGRYRATWRVRRARQRTGGRVQDPELSLIDLSTGKDLSGHSKTETLKQIEELVGLRFEQFCSSVLLAQGGFAQFLQARPDDRADLLEKMTGTAIYGAVSMLAHQRAGEEGRRLQDLLAKEQARPLLPEDERARIVARRAELCARREEMEKELEGLRRAARVLDDLERLSTELAAAEQALRAAHQAHAEQRDKLSRTRALEEQRVRHLRQMHEAMQADLGAAQARLQAFQQQHPPAQLRRERERLDAQLGTCEALLHLQQEIRARAERHEQKRRLAEEAEQRAVERHAAAGSARARHAALSEEEKAKQADLALAREAQKLAARRADLLHDGKPCPLCGSLDHPYSKRPAPLSRLVAGLQAECERLHAAVEAARREAEQADKEAHGREQVAEQARKDMKEAAREAERLRATFAERRRGLSLPAGADAESADVLQALLQELSARKQAAVRIDDEGLRMQQTRDGLQRACDDLLKQVKTLEQAAREAVARAEQEERAAELRAAGLRSEAAVRAAARARGQAEAAALAGGPGPADDAARRAELKQRLQERRAQADALAEELALCGARLLQDEEDRQALADLRPRLERQRQLAGRYEQIARLIGSTDGKKFRRFAQGLSLDALLEHANYHLGRLQPRYRLQRIPSYDMDLQIIDRDLGSVARGVTTLSGGETFLVSLALALGLSSLSARDVQVESLFIDEGFGTLDRDALEVALATLDQLQGQGRQVGLISHVGDLAERIPQQVRIDKRGPGASTVTILPQAGLPQPAPIPVQPVQEDKPAAPGFSLEVQPARSRPDPKRRAR